MSPLEAIAAGPYNLFYSIAVAAAAAVMFVAGRRRGWGPARWALCVVAWVTAGMVGTMLPRALFGDVIAYRTAIGGVAFSTVVLAVMAQAIRRELTEVLDTTAVAIPVGAAIVRVGCFFAECCQGIATSLPIGVALHADDVPRHPVQLYESALEVALAMVIARRSEWSRPGRRFAASIGGLSAIRFATEFLRDNDKFGGLSLAQWIVLPLGASCLILLLSRKKQIPRFARDDKSFARDDKSFARDDKSFARDDKSFARDSKRVLTASARRATLIAIGALVIAAVAVELPALESTLLLLGVALLIVAWVRRVGGVAPTGLAVLALQMPAIRADSAYPRLDTFFGLGGNVAMWDFRHQYTDCEGTTHQDWTRHHVLMGGAAEMGARAQHSATRFFTIRASGFAAGEDIGKAHVLEGTPTDPQGYFRQTYGFSIIGDADWKYLGLSAGVSAGRLYPMLEDDNNGPTTDRPTPLDAFPAFRLRIGKHNGFAFETRVGNESPTWIPAPAASMTLAYGSNGNRFRAGVTEAGILLAGEKVLPSGTEILPMILLPGGGDATLQNAFSAGIMVRKWIRGGRPPQDGR